MWLEVLRCVTCKGDICVLFVNTQCLIYHFICREKPVKTTQMKFHSRVRPAFYFVTLRIKVLLLLVADLGYVSPQPCTQMALIADFNTSHNKLLTLFLLLFSSNAGWKWVIIEIFLMYLGMFIIWKQYKSCCSPSQFEFHDQSHVDKVSVGG